MICAVGTAGFEGEIEQESHFLTGGSDRVVQILKGTRRRVDDGSASLIFDLATRKKYVVDRGARTFQVFDWDTPSADAGAPFGSKTGRHEVIAGYGCDVFERREASGETTELCVTTEIYSPVLIAAGAMGGFGGDLGYPLRQVHRMASGRELNRIEVLRVTKRPVADADVSVPSGFVETK